MDVSDQALTSGGGDMPEEAEEQHSMGHKHEVVTCPDTGQWLDVVLFRV